MNNYLVLKKTGNGTKSGCSAVVINLDEKGRKSKRVVGNIPELYHGMTIMLDVAEGVVLDYILKENEKNKKALEKAGVNSREYFAILKKHSVLKKDGISWNVAKMALNNIYEALPFKEADKVHKEMINKATEPTRVEAINKKIIETARNKRKIAYKVEEYLGYFNDVEQDGAYQQLMVSLKIMCLQASRYGVKNGIIWDSELKNKEDYIKQNILSRNNAEYSLLNNSEIQKFIEEIQDRGLETEQIDTLYSLKNSTPCIITGGAGVGKTTVIQAIIDCYGKYYSKRNILLVAPTGKASRRLAEKTGMPASTIHKALRKNPDEDFVYYGENNPLPHRLIVVDESSMIDTALMYDLLSAVDVTSKIIFVGDHNQLYPVGYGEPFFDFLKVLDVFTLKINHRQEEGTDILEVANGVLDDKPLQSGRGVLVKEVTFDDIGNIVSTIDDDTQILSPYNNLNAQINSFLKKGEGEFNVGDRVMTVRNTKSYCNGDMGVVKGIDSKGTITIDIEGKDVKITKAYCNDLMLAYSVTIHKMQGSEMDRIIVILPKHDNLVEKRMIYTAVTRARKELEVYYYEA